MSVINYSDWYFPSLNQLHQIYVSVRSTASMQSSTYWCSSEYINAPYLYAKSIDFSDGSVYTNTPKGNTLLYRACREFTYITGYFTVGQFGEAGYIYYITDNGDGTSLYYEVAPPSGEGSDAWSNDTIGSAGTYDGQTYGQYNTTHIMAQTGAVSGCAFDCDNLTLTGHSYQYPPTISYLYGSPYPYFLLTWTGHFTQNLNHYVLQYSTNGGSSWSTLATESSGTTQAVISCPVPSNKMWRVGAVENGGTTWYSSGLTVYAIYAPTGTTVYAQYCSHVNVEWTNNNNNYVNHNMVQTNPSGTWINYTSVGSGTTNSAVYFAPSTHLPIRVGSVAPDGSTQWGSSVTGITLTVTNPTNLTASMSGTSVALNWINVNNNGEGIQIWRSHNSVNTFLVTVATTVDSYLDTTAVQGETYIYQIASVCGVNNYWSNSATISVTSAYIAPRSLISDIYFIRFNDQALYDIVLDNFEINYQLADIKNLSQANTTYTIPISIPYTQHTRQVFGSLFNVNSQSPITDIKIPCKLYYHDKCILDGYGYINFSTIDYIQVVLARNDINIFVDCGSNTLADLVFTGNSYTYHNKTQYDFLNNWNNNLTGNTLNDHDFVMLDWWNVGDSQDVLNSNRYYRYFYYPNNNPSTLLQNYPMTPVVRVKTIFDKIFSTYGYTYTGSSSFIDKLNGMYMTTTVPRSNYTQNVDSVYNFQQGGSYGSAYYLNYFYESGNTYAYTTQIANTSKILGNFCNTNYSSIGVSTNIPLFKGQELTVTVNLYGYTNSSTGTTEVTLQALIEPPTIIDLVTLPIIKYTGSSTNQLYTVTTTFKVPDNLGFSEYVVIKIVNNSATPLTRVNQVGYSDANIIITTPNYFYYTGNTYTLNNLLPNSYTQFDFLNDICNMFDLSIYADNSNISFLHLETQADFNTQQVLDWTKKFTTDNFEIYDTSQQIYNQYTFGNANAGDKISKSYENYTTFQLNEKIVNNTNQLAINQASDIRLTVPQGVLNYALKSQNFYYLIYEGKLVYKECPIMTYYDNENSAIIFGYINKIRLGYYNNETPLDFRIMCYSDGYIGGNNITLGTWSYEFLGYPVDLWAYQTLSPFRISGFTNTQINSDLSQIGNKNTFALLFNSNDTYLIGYTGNTITNNNLYNNFWKEDVESKLFSNQKFIKSYIRLRENDLDIRNFKKKIFISNPKVGDAYYRINKIVYPTDITKVSYVELTTDLNYISNYSGTSYINIYGYNPNTDSSNLVRQGGVTPPPPPPISTTYVSFDHTSGQNVIMGINKQEGQTFALRFAYQVEADTHNGSSQAISRIHYSLDAGNTWLTMASAEVYTSNQQQIIQNQVVIPNITDITKVWFYPYFGNSSIENSFWVQLVDVSPNFGSSYFVCPNYIHANAQQYTPILDCR